MKNFIISIIFILICNTTPSIVLATDVGKSDEKSERLPDEKGLTDDEDQFLATIPHYQYTDKDVILPNGENLQDYIDKHPIETKGKE